MGINPIPEHSPIQPAQAAKGSTDQNEAEQMIYMLNILISLSVYLQDGLLMGDLSGIKSRVEQELQKTPPDLQGAQNLLNSAISDFNNEVGGPQFPKWNMSEDQSKPGFSFMNCLLSFAQLLSGHYPNNSALQNWVTKLAVYSNNGPWDANSVYNTVNSFISTVDAQGYDPDGEKITIKPLTSNIFS